MTLTNLEKNPTHFDEVKQFLATWNDDNQYINQLTSGSTGIPKNIKIEKWKMKESAKMTGDFFMLKNRKSALLCISPQYIGGKMMIVRAFLYHLELVLLSPTSNPLKNLNRPIDFAAMVPLQVEEALLKNPEKLNLIKNIIIGGAPVSEHLVKELKKLDSAVYSTFGMTETVSHIALKNLKKENAAFQAIGNTTFSTEDDCLVINSNELKIKNLKTNDRITLINDKSFHWLGRADFVINSGGIKIQPEIVEKKIRTILPSAEFIISSLADEKLGQKVVFIGEEAANIPEIKEKIAQIVAKYEKPKDFYFLPFLYKTGSGKIDRIRTTNALK